MASEGVRYRGKSTGTDMRTFVSEGKANFLSLLGGYIVLGVFLTFVSIAVFTVIVFISLILSMILSFAFELGGSVGSMFNLLMIVFSPVGILIILVSNAFLQFFDVGVVVRDDKVIHALKNSYRMARQNPVSVAGYTVLRYILTVFFVVSPLVAFLKPSLVPPQFNEILLSFQNRYALYIFLFAVIGTVSNSILNTFHVAYYCELSDSSNLIDTSERSIHDDTTSTNTRISSGIEE
ncbi:MAG: hypothetical protein SXQ77_08555 [Halobacteria archaeon]|nr:hypothetical protein [Halobacteria archaeon]